MSRVEDCKLIQLEKFENPGGNLTPLYGEEHVPFAIQRVFYLYDVPGGADRGGHAHWALQQMVVAASGSFSVTIDDGRSRRTISLDRSYYGLYVPNLIWTEITGFCTGAICLVFASLLYDESDYIRDYHEFLTTVHSPAKLAGSG
jgi:hypothetical protein